MLHPLPRARRARLAILVIAALGPAVNAALADAPPATALLSAAALAGVSSAPAAVSAAPAPSLPARSPDSAPALTPFPPDPPAPKLPVLARADDGSWRVEGLGKGVYLFRWSEGAYVSVFVVGDRGVLATDPINRRAAVAYREAIARITPLPITQILYSHDHRDHIVGADVLAPNAEIIAHRLTRSRIRYRHDTDIPIPTRLVEDGDVLRVGSHVITVHYYGPNHSESNLGLTYDTDYGVMLQFVDTLEIGIVPYRTLPDTQIRGYLATLAAAAKLHPDIVLGGHSGPGPGIWVEHYRDYFEDLESSCLRAMNAPTGPSLEGPQTTVNGIIASGEAHTARVILAVMNDLQPRYGTWAGFHDWAPLNIQAMLMYLTTGD
jgi:glyoxylase-like metal-dependent hydrolase (beta-lactamase superfamily II)